MESENGSKRNKSITKTDNVRFEVTLYWTQTEQVRV